MFNAPSILIAGNETLYLDLSERLPKSCRVYFCETIGETLDRAVDASIVLVDASIDGGGTELCRRLRTDPMTTGIPLLLLSSDKEQAHVADRVVAPQIEAALAALQAFLPDLRQSTVAPAAGNHTQESPYFDLDRNTISWRPGAAADDWPPAPPSLSPQVDILHYTQALAGYVNSLVEGHERSETLEPEQRSRLDDMSGSVLGMMEHVLGEAQQAVNAALRDKNLERLRELSAAKTALFERLQRLRTITRRSSQTALPAAPTPATTSANLSATGPRPSPANAGTNAVERQTRAMTGPGHPAAPQREVTTAEKGTPDRLGTTGPLPASAATSAGLGPTKSQLTIAAEKKERERRQAGGRTHGGPPQRPAKARPPRGVVGNARRRPARKQAGPRSSSRLVIAISLVAIVGVLWYAVAHRRQESTDSRPSNNAPPTLKYVTIQQTPTGVIARPLAEDREGDRVVYAIRWFVNGSLVENARTARLSPDNYQPNATVQVEVTPTDSFGAGEPMRSQELVIVTNPTAPRRAAAGAATEVR